MFCSSFLVSIAANSYILLYLCIIKDFILVSTVIK